MRGLTGFQRDLLFVLGHLDSSDGVELKRELERSRYSSILSGRLYHNLDVLVDRSLIRKRDCEGRTNEYRLTPEGREEIRAHRDWQRQYVGTTPSELSPSAVETQSGDSSSG
jgi:DNA-binding PadR family transcriptional regulator